jgi:lipopolysaccharide transport system permease protein
MREGVCWYYDRGWPFLLVEGAAKDGVVKLGRVRVTTSATLRRERELRAVGRAFVYPVLTIWRNRGLIRVMVRRDILGRYRGSFGGAFWTLINPLLLMLTYFFVFGVVCARASTQDQSRSGFALYFLAGMLPWLAFSEAAGRSPG